MFERGELNSETTYAKAWNKIVRFNILSNENVWLQNVKLVSFDAKETFFFILFVTMFLFKTYVNYELIFSTYYSKWSF